MDAKTGLGPMYESGESVRSRTLAEDPATERLSNEEYNGVLGMAEDPGAEVLS